MRKRDAINDLNSCLNKAHEDEPVFVLRANDLVAPETVERWAESYRGLHIQKGTFTSERQSKYSEAYRVAMAMREWRKAVQSAAAHQPLIAAEALNALREKVKLQGDELVLMQGFWVTLRESLGLGPRVQEDLFQEKS